MRFLYASIVGTAILFLGSFTYAQTGYKNSTDDWMKVSSVNGSDHHELLGWIYVAPKSTLYMEGGKVTGGAGKFVAEADGKLILACMVMEDKLIDYFAVEASTLSWNVLGNPIDIALRRPIVTYHLATGNATEGFVEKKLSVEAKYPGFNVVHKTDVLAMKEAAGQAKRTPSMFVSFDVKDGDKSVRKNMGLFLHFERCEYSTSAPPSPRQP